MTLTDSQIDALLEALDTASRGADTYPPRGLGIWGSEERRALLRLVVRHWSIEVSAEAQR